VDPLFLTVEQVILINKDQVSRYGGIHGVLHPALLESAVNTPAQTMFGQFLHPDMFAMSAAYAFHICQNHPFHDGNKRTAVASALVFLRWNGVETLADQRDFEAHILGVATGTHSKDDIARLLRGGPL